jgi:hypothetical protein
MLDRVRPVPARLLPHGWLDLLRQVLLFAVAYYGYALVRGLADERGVVVAAYENARTVIGVERGLQLFVEPAVQGWALSSALLVDSSSWIYINAQTSVSIGALTFIYLFRNDSFYFVRNMILVAMTIALAGYLLFPTAPPRLLPEWGFFDSVSDFAGVEPDSAVNSMFNPYAAVPSMHVAFSMMIGWSLARLVRHTWARAAWAAYPFLVTFVIVVTANHFLLDAVLGALTAATAALAARHLARARPTAWRFARRSVLST